MIDFGKVSEVYIGRAGKCMCGCSGKYHVATHFGVEAANKECGYPAYTKCNDKMVRKALSVVNKNIDFADVCDDYASIDVDGRRYTAYFVANRLNDPRADTANKTRSSDDHDPR